MPFVKGYKWTEKQHNRCGFEKGVTPWNKGKTNIYSKDVLTLMSIAKKGMVSSFNGKKHSQESRDRIKEGLSMVTFIRKGAKGKPWSLSRREAEKKRTRRKPRKLIFMRGKEYPFDWREIRKNIYKRDGWICQECGVHCNNKRKIQCHHVDYDTTNSACSNLITLCASCHPKTLYRREDWSKHYKNIMEARGLITFEN